MPDRSRSPVGRALVCMSLLVSCVFDESGATIPQSGSSDASVADASAAVDAASSTPDGAPVPDANDIPILSFQRTGDTPQEGGGGGAPHEDICPTGQLMTGLAGSNDGGDEYIGQISAQCSAATLSPDGSGGFDIELATGQQLPARGDGGGSSWIRDCDAGDVMVGFDGRAGAYLDRLFVRCASLTVSGAPEALTFTTGNPYELTLVGGGGGSPFPHRDCPDGEVVTTTRIRAGSFVDAFGVGCALPQAN